MKSRLLLRLALLCSLVLLVQAPFASAQGARIGSGQSPLWTTTTTTGSNVLLTTIANGQIHFCSAPANAVPCTNFATTYTDSTLTSSCATSTPVVLDGTTTCVAGADAQGNWGVWVPPGQYQYTVTSGSVSTGPYSISASPATDANGNVAIPGNLAAKSLWNTIDASQYGVKADCATDNTTALTTVFATAFTLGYNILLPEGAPGSTDCILATKISLTLPVGVVRGIKVFGVRAPGDFEIIDPTRYQGTILKFTDATGPAISIDGGGSYSGRQIEFKDFAIICSDTTNCLDVQRVNEQINFHNLTIFQSHNGGSGCQFRNIWVNFKFENNVLVGPGGTNQANTYGCRFWNPTLDAGQYDISGNNVGTQFGSSTTGWDMGLMFGATAADVSGGNGKIIDSIHAAHNTSESSNTGYWVGYAAHGFVGLANHAEGNATQAVKVSTNLAGFTWQGGELVDVAATAGEIVIQCDGSNNEYGIDIEGVNLLQVFNKGISLGNLATCGGKIKNNFIACIGAGSKIGIDYVNAYGQYWEIGPNVITGCSTTYTNPVTNAGLGFDVTNGFSWGNGGFIPNSNTTGSGNLVRATSPALVTPQISLLTNGTGLQIFNTSTTCTTGASIGATCTTGNINLPVAEGDTSYRVTCTGKGVTNVPVVIATTNTSATQFTITVAALTAAAASFASYDCTAGHN